MKVIISNHGDHEFETDFFDHAVWNWQNFEVGESIWLNFEMSDLPLERVSFESFENGVLTISANMIPNEKHDFVLKNYPTLYKTIIRPLHQINGYEPIITASLWFTGKGGHVCREVERLLNQD